MKILLVSTGPRYSLYLAAQELNKYCETKIINAGFTTDYDVEIERDQSLECNNINVVGNFDIIFGVDHGCINALVELKTMFPKIKFGVQILDYPKHILTKNSMCYDEGRVQQWNQWKQILPKMDFLLYNKKSSYDDLSELYDKVLSMSLLYPINSMKVNDYSNKGYVVYSGRVNQDRRVDLIIEAISRSKSKPKLIIATVVNNNTIDFSIFAKERGVDYVVMDRISEQTKFDLYANSCFIISADYSYCPASCVMQGLSIGKNSLSFETSNEHLSTYGPYIEYGDSDIDMFAEKIDLLYYNDEYREKFKQERISYFNANASYEVWGKKVFNFMSKLI